MGGYTKNIAVIKGLKEGFSTDGGPLTGLVKAERYGASLKIEVTFCNFAALSEGRYVCAVSDGLQTLVVEDGFYEGASALDTSGGFAALICYINGGVYPVASAISGNFHGAALSIKSEVEKLENVKPATKAEEKAVYEDEAIAEVNYFEFAETDESSGTVRKNTQKKADGNKAVQDEAAFGSVKKDDGQGRGVEKGPLSHGGMFYERMKGEIEGILSAYPCEEALEKTVEHSKWVKITYGDGNFYVFGVIYNGKKPQYICYGVPTESSGRPPESMQGLASFIPLSPDERQKGYWVMYQDAATGASLKIDLE